MLLLLAALALELRLGGGVSGFGLRCGQLLLFLAFTAVVLVVLFV